MPVGTCVVGSPSMPPPLMNKFIHVDRLRLRRSAKWEKENIMGNNRACGLAITGQSGGGGGGVELLLFPFCSQVIELEEGRGRRERK